MTKPIKAAAPVIVDDVDDDFCSCSESIYHSFINTVDSTHLSYPSPKSLEVPYEPVSLSVDLVMDPLALKARRSTDCARQRLKKPMDIAKAKRHPVSSCGWCSRFKVTKSLRSPGANRVLRHDVTEAKVDAKLITERSREWSDSTGDVSAPTRVSEAVSLLDLVKPPSRSAEKRFELIKRPRQVLVLDDFTEIDQDRYDLDDWEHIPSPNHQGKGFRRSYAKVVATKA